VDKSMIARVKAADQLGGSLGGGLALAEQIEIPRFTYQFECRDSKGRLKWTEVAKNLVTTAGGNDLLTQYFKGSAYTAAWYLGLISTTGFTAFAAGDTSASHSGWAESVAYSNSTRVTLAFGTAASKSLAASGAVFNINATDTIHGAFTITSNTKSGTTGVLYSAGAFTADRAVLSGDTLTVTPTLSC
jgi:hypothetical protein